MNSIKKVIAINVGSLVVLLGGGAAGVYFYNQSHDYLKTDNAKVDAQQIVVSSPANGKLVEWNAQEGEFYNHDGILGKVRVSAPTASNPAATTDVNVTLPVDANLVQSNAVKNGLVAAGTTLGYAYDLNKLFVTANIKETLVQDIEEGDEVDIYVDAFGDTPLKGKVENIKKATASSFSLMPSSNTNANYTKVTQVVPVKVSIDDTKGLDIVPGMNVSVRIHKN